ncbi:MAG TPA: hypothetical protein VFW06_02075 [Acidimicrobiia bacterium]|nr:hypothetical protein [Acidimicrobiia bacterium]
MRHDDAGHGRSVRGIGPVPPPAQDDVTGPGYLDIAAREAASSRHDVG